MSSTTGNTLTPRTSTYGVPRRYTDAYRVATAIINVAGVVKVVGVLLGILLAVGGFAAQSEYVLFPALVAALLTAFSFYWFGVMIAAQGQILLATLDTAVNTSPFLDDDQRAQIMSLPEAQKAAERVVYPPKPEVQEAAVEKAGRVVYPPR